MMVNVWLPWKHSQVKSNIQKKLLFKKKKKNRFVKTKQLYNSRMDGGGVLPVQGRGGGLIPGGGGPKNAENTGEQR